MFLPACVTALFLMFSVHGTEVVARVYFSQTSYVVNKSSMICVDVINEIPASTHLRVDYEFSTQLSGASAFINPTRNDFFAFPANSNRTQLCIGHKEDNLICEDQITGTITLSDQNPSVVVVSPSSVIVTIEDNDLVTVSFEQQFYELWEGSSMTNVPIVNTTLPTGDVVIEVIEEVSAASGSAIIEPSLMFSSPEMITLDEVHKRVPLTLRDDNIALEDPEVAMLTLRLSQASPCPTVQLSPLISTTVLIHDDDNVIATLTESEGTVREGEDHQVCVTLSKPIARTLTFTLQIHSGTANLDDLEESTQETTVLEFLPRSERRKCVQFTPIDDHIIERNEEYFMVVLTLETNLPAGVRNNVQLGTVSARITIQETRSCLNYNLNSITTPSKLYVHPERTVCFSCSTCISQITWTLTSHRRVNWTGTTGNLLRAMSRIPVGEVLLDGTLKLFDSSKVFSALQPGTLRFVEVKQDQPKTSEYEISLGEKAEVTNLQYTRTDNVATLTCLFTGAPQPEVEWLSNSQPIANQGVVIQQIDQSEGESVLIIDAKMAMEVNVMTYTCKASNSFGFDTLNHSISSVETSPLNNGANTLHYLAYSLFSVSLLLSQLL